MSPSQPNQKQSKPAGGDAWAEAQRAIRDRNDDARRAGKKERLDSERRHEAEQRARDQRAGVVR